MRHTYIDPESPATQGIYNSVYTHMSETEGADRVQHQSDSGWRQDQLEGGNCDVDLSGTIPLVHVGQNLLRQWTKDLDRESEVCSTQ